MKLVVLGGDDHLGRVDVGRFPLIDRLAGALGLYLIGLCLINLVSVVLQCGFGQCHTFGYELLE